MNEVDSQNSGEPDGRDLPIEDLNLTIRSYNILIRKEIETIGELTEWSAKALLLIPNFNMRLLDEVEFKLSLLGLTLKTESP